MTQVTLKHQIDGNHSRSMTTWLEQDKRIKQNVKLTLKDDPDTLWTVTEVFGTQELNEIDHHGWDNNNYDKHEGLKLT